MMATINSIFSRYRGRRVLVAGPSGFIGGWVARLLAEAGADLCLVGRNEKKLQEACHAYGIRGEVHIADFSQLGAFARVYNLIRPTITFNLAGFGVNRDERDPASAEALNVRLVREMVEVIAENGAIGWEGQCLVHVGSAAEYGPVEGTLTEDSHAAPALLYGQTKLAGTQYLLSARERTGIRAVTARLFTVYGPGEHAERLLPSLLRAARTGETLPLTAGEQRRDFTYVGDVAEGLLRLGVLPQVDRKSTRLNSSHPSRSRMPSSA